MKTRITLVAMLLLPGGLIALLAKTPPDTPEQQIGELEDKVNGAYAANDRTAYFSFYAPDFSQWLPEGRTDPATYQKEWTGFIHGGGRVESENYSDLHIQVGPSGDTAVAVAAPRPDPRHRIEHAGNNEAGPTTVEQLERTKRRGVIPVPTGAWIYLGHAVFKTQAKVPFLYRTMLDHGLRPPGTSDSLGDAGVHQPVL